MVQDVSLKVTILLDLMGEVNKCRKYLVIPRFLLSTGEPLLRDVFSNGFYGYYLFCLMDYILLHDTSGSSLADEGVRLKLQFSNRELLFDFAVLLDLRYKSQWLLLSY